MSDTLNQLPIIKRVSAPLLNCKQRLCIYSLHCVAIQLFFADLIVFNSFIKNIYLIEKLLDIETCMSVQKWGNNREY